jgi:hypothetical protein
VGVHGRARDADLGGDRLRGLSRGDRAEDLELAVAQAVNGSRVAGEDRARDQESGERAEGESERATAVHHLR